jgi:hypothetical protein
MTKLDDALELAGQIARIASRSNEPEIAHELMQLVEGLLTEAGLPQLPAATQDDPHRPP